MSVSNDRELVAVDLISIPNAAIRIGLSAETVYRLARAGQFEPAIRLALDGCLVFRVSKGSLTATQKSHLELSSAAR